MTSLKGKVAVVTGASKGIGAAIAKDLAKAGASVVVNYSSSKEGADKVVAEIVKKDGKAIAVHGDVSKEADVVRIFAETKKEFGQVDVLVNNAGIYKFLPLEEVTEQEYLRQFNTNVLGVLMMSREALKYFGEGSSIINISSVAATNPPPGSSIYSATKGAVDTITIELSRELASRKIRVNAVSPGGTKSEGTVTAGIVGSDFEKQMIASTPLGRMGEPEDIAGAVTFLASDAASWVTGEILRSAGGAR